MKVYQQMTKSEVDIPTWVDNNIDWRRWNGYSCFIIIQSYLKVVICNSMTPFIFWIYKCICVPLKHLLSSNNYDSPTVVRFHILHKVFGLMSTIVSVLLCRNLEYTNHNNDLSKVTDKPLSHTFVSRYTRSWRESK